jgi:phosphatidylserine/phosphatidylglycerophosphate/cardiolipin synthase-like enzyme
MKNKNTLILLLLGILIGVLIGAGAHEMGTDRACPTRTCVDSADVTPVTDRGYFDAAHKTITEAKKSVHIIAFELKHYTSQTSLENQLIRDIIYAKERGLDVKVIVDEFSTDNNAYDMLKANGVEIRMDSPETTTHAKLIIVDGKKTLIGSTNLSYFALERNNEANVLIDDENTAQYFEKYFQNLWSAIN